LERGHVLLSSWWLLRKCASAEEAEAEACLEGVRLSAQWVRQPTIIEVDCSSVIKALRNEPGDRLPLGGVLKEIRATCALLPEFRLLLIRREANMVAHALARKAMLSKEFVVMRLNYPQCIKSQVEAEAPTDRDSLSSIGVAESRGRRCKIVIT
jgi:hypothetical protein